MSWSFTMFTSFMSWLSMWRWMWNDNVIQENHIIICVVSIQWWTLKSKWSLAISPIIWFEVLNWVHSEIIIFAGKSVAQLVLRNQHALEGKECISSSLGYQVPLGTKAPKTKDLTKHIIIYISHHEMILLSSGTLSFIKYENWKHVIYLKWCFNRTLEYGIICEQLVL